jgi:hypothetical protein
VVLQVVQVPQVLQVKVMQEAQQQLLVQVAHADIPAVAVVVQLILAQMQAQQ